MEKNSNNPDNNSPAKPKKVASIPASRFSLAQTAIKVAACWAADFPALVVPNENQRTLSQQANTMNAHLVDAKALEAKQQRNSNDMKLLNKELDKEVTYLKKSLKFVFYEQKNLASYYSEYGLVLVNQTNYGLPRDNDERAAALIQLLNKLQEPNNPVATHAFGLAQWQTLQNKHNQLWVESEAIRRQRSGLSSKINQLYTPVRGSLRQIHAYMAFEYKGEELKKKRREIGFLKESF